MTDNRTDNQVIWNFLGLLCIHTQIECPDYSGDPGAWTQDVYAAIESNPIAGIFIKNLEDEVLLDTCYPPESQSMPWLFLTATPPQKASALAAAIKEAEIV